MPSFESLPGYRGTSLEGKAGFDANDMRIRADQINALRPTGDPIVDASEMDRILFHGRLKPLERTRRGALRGGVIAYMFLEDIGQDDYQGDEMVNLVQSAKIACVERILSHYGVKARDLESFDKEFPL